MIHQKFNICILVTPLSEQGDSNGDENNSCKKDNVSQRQSLFVASHNESSNELNNSATPTNRRFNGIYSVLNIFGYFYYRLDNSVF